MRRWPLLYQILIVNSAIVFLGASAGTVITRQLASTSSIVSLTGFFAALGLILSIVANYLLLRVALRPLLVLQTVAELVASGDLNARAEQLAGREPSLARLANTFNAMLDRLEEDNHAIARSRELTEALTQQVLSAQEEERRRIARELHDETLQSLATLVIYADAAASAAAQPPAALHDALVRLRDVADYTIASVRDIIADLRPSLLDDLGLAAAIRWQAQHRLEAAGLHVDVQIRGEGRRLAPAVEVVLYRVVQEAISNILKHAAASYVEIDLDLSRDDRVVVRVEDDGVGFGLPARADLPARTGVGLFGMQERINLLNGDLVVDSSPGEGTEIRVAVPLVQAARERQPLELA